MAEHIYDRLADALNALPNRFPRTASGVEIKLIKKVYTPEEVELAGQMGRTFESAADIAKRAGLPEEKVKALLAGMAAKGVASPRVDADGVQRFRLAQFVVGWYERTMQSGDKEFAQLFEQYMAEAGAKGVMGPRPGIGRVVPSRGSVKPELLQPYDDIDAYFNKHQRFRVSDCVCRVQKKLVGSDCQQPAKRCGFGGMPSDTPLARDVRSAAATTYDVLDREQALNLFTELEQTGHVHISFYRIAEFTGGCNCCGDCCGVLRGITDWGQPEAVQRSNYRAVLDLEKCNGCGNCIERCQVKAISAGKDGMPVLHRDKCIGCGLCVIACPTDATEMALVSRSEWFDVPATFTAWEEERLRRAAV